MGGMRTNQQRIADLESLLAEKEGVVASLENERDAKFKDWEVKVKALTLESTRGIVQLEDQVEDATGIHQRGQSGGRLLRSHSHEEALRRRLRHIDCMEKIAARQPLCVAVPQHGLPSLSRSDAPRTSARVPSPPISVVNAQPKSGKRKPKIHVADKVVNAQPNGPLARSLPSTRLGLITWNPPSP